MCVSASRTPRAVAVVYLHNWHGLNLGSRLDFALYLGVVDGSHSRVGLGSQIGGELCDRLGTGSGSGVWVRCCDGRELLSNSGDRNDHSLGRQIGGLALPDAGADVCG